MSANCIQNPVLVHLRPNKQRPVSAGLFVSSLWLIFHCSLISSSVLPIEISIHCESWQGRPALFQLYFFPQWKSHTVINEASAISPFFFALKEVGVDKVPGGLYGAGWLTKWSTWLARERLWSWMRCRKKKRGKKQQRTSTVIAGHYRVCFRWEILEKHEFQRKGLWKMGAWCGI